VAGGLAFAAVFVAWATPRAAWRAGIVVALRRGFDRLLASWAWFLPGAGVALFHLVAVNFIEPNLRPWWLATTGVDFTAGIVAIEDGFVRSFDAIHTPVLTWLVTWFYLAVHHGFVVIAPIWLLATGETRLGRRLIVGIVATYLLAQPGFLLLPIDNPTVHYHGADAPTLMESVFPGVDAVFYRGTTIDNTLPSMHIGLAFLGFWHGRQSSNRRMRVFATVYAPLVAFSVLYLQVHWALDVVGGILVAWLGTRSAAWLVPRIEARGRARASTGNAPLSLK